MRFAIAAVLVLSSFGLAGCIECNPSSVDAVVTLAPSDLQVRSLPILASGATNVAGIEVPDSHARLEFDVAVRGGPSFVEVEGLEVEVRVDGSPVPIEVHRVDGSGRWASSGSAWRGDLMDGGSLTIWWGVDWQRAGVDAIVLGEGEDVEVGVSFAWRVADCFYVSSGTVEHPARLPVSASLATTTFEAAGAARLDPGALAGATFEANLRVANGLTTRIDGGDAVAVLLPTGVGAPGAAVWTGVETYVGALPSSTVSPGETLRVTQEAPALWSGGTKGLAVLVVHLRHHAADGTAGVQDDVLGFAVEV